MNLLHMKKVLLFGSTGNIGKKIAEELVNRGYEVTAVVRKESKRKAVEAFAQYCRVADVTKSSSLAGICDGYEIVVSALGKSVSPNDKSKPSFRDVDLEANSAILQEATKSGVRKFVYISALHAERYPHLEYFRVHHEFSSRLKASGLDYAIIKPPAVFSAFIDLVQMAKKGQLFTLGKGDKLTNPIYEGDLAQVCAESIHQLNAEREVGGKEVLSRHQINELIQQMINPTKKVRRVPLGVMKAVLPVIKIFSPNMYDKIAFFTQVVQHDTIAPRVGETTLTEYVKRQMADVKKKGATN
jgi:uncharacterized protein YbjT (DUF2867 family)